MIQGFQQNKKSIWDAVDEALITLQFEMEKNKKEGIQINGYSDCQRMEVFI